MVTMIIWGVKAQVTWYSHRAEYPEDLQRSYFLPKLFCSHDHTETWCAPATLLPWSSPGNGKPAKVTPRAHIAHKDL